MTTAPPVAVDRRAPWLTVARREIVSKLTDRSFIIGTVLTLALIGGFMGISAWMDERTKTHDVVVVAADRSMADTVAKGVQGADDKVKVIVTEVPDAARAEADVRDGQADAWLHKGGEGWVLTGKNEVDSGLQSATQAVIRQNVIAENAAAAGTDAASLEKGSTLSTTLLVGDADKQDFAKAMGFALAFLFYMASLGFGYTIAGSVVEEKASRIVEIIATKIPIRQLLIGKVLGNTALAIAQTAVYVGLGFIGLAFTPYKSMLPSISAGVGWFLGFFLVGFLLIACLWAVVGALASRSEDLQQTATPLTFLMMGIFFATFLAKGAWLTVLSYVPPFSAILMPIRVLQGTAAWWEPIAALAILLAAAGVVVWVAERLYRRALLQTSGRLSWRQAWAVAE
jgi:ABC-2 type transport system permease protein